MTERLMVTWFPVPTAIPYALAIGGGSRRHHTGAGIAADDRVLDEELGGAAGARVDDALLGEIQDLAVVDLDSCCGLDEDADGPGVAILYEAIQSEIAQDHVAPRRIDDDTVRSAENHNRSKHIMTVDSDRICDGYCRGETLVNRTRTIDLSADFGVCKRHAERHARNR
jgi:hypothetical protein